MAAARATRLNIYKSAKNLTFTLDLNYQNNFLSEIDCVRRCGDKAAIDALALPELGPTPSLPEIGNFPRLVCPAYYCHPNLSNILRRKETPLTRNVIDANLTGAC